MISLTRQNITIHDLSKFNKHIRWNITKHIHEKIKNLRCTSIYTSICRIYRCMIICTKPPTFPYEEGSLHVYQLAMLLDLCETTYKNMTVSFRLIQSFNSFSRVSVENPGRSYNFKKNKQKIVYIRSL